MALPPICFTILEIAGYDNNSFSEQEGSANHEHKAVV